MFRVFFSSLLCNVTLENRRKNPEKLRSQVSAPTLGCGHSFFSDPKINFRLIRKCCIVYGKKEWFCVHFDLGGPFWERGFTCGRFIPKLDENNQFDTSLLSSNGHTGWANDGKKYFKFIKHFCLRGHLWGPFSQRENTEAFLFFLPRLWRNESNARHQERKRKKRLIFTRMTSFSNFGFGKFDTLQSLGVDPHRRRKCWKSMGEALEMSASELKETNRFRIPAANLFPPTGQVLCADRNTKSTQKRHSQG